MSRYSPPELLAARHQLAGFRCRSKEQTGWLVELAKQAHGTGTTRVFVVTESDQPAVVVESALSLERWPSCSITPGMGAHHAQRCGGIAGQGVHSSGEGPDVGIALQADRRRLPSDPLSASQDHRCQEPRCPGAPGARDWPNT